MPRRVNTEENSAKRNEILDAATRLVYTKGYEQTTIQDLLDALQISKGAFYHYFDSKQAVLEGMIERLLNEGEQLFAPLLEDPTLPTLVRLQRFFDTSNPWKIAEKRYMLVLVRVWYTDNNAIVRQKLQLSAMRRFAPLLTKLVVQGHEEGVLNAPYPEQAGPILLTLLTGLSETIAGLLLHPEAHPDAAVEAEQLVHAYNDTLERVLGAPRGSLQLMDHDTIREWFALAA